MHKLAPRLDEAKGVGELEGARGDEGAVFPQTMTGDVGHLAKLRAAFFKGPKNCDAGREDRRLLHFRGHQCLFGALEAAFAEGVAQSLLGAFKDGPRRFELETGVLGHPHALRTLAGKEQREQACYSPSSSWIRVSPA